MQHYNLCLVNQKPQQPLRNIEYLAFGVGSIRGLALISAYETLLNTRDINLNLKGISGSSVGSIMCMAIILKLTVQEMKDFPNKQFLSNLTRIFKLAKTCEKLHFLQIEYLKKELIIFMNSKNISELLTFDEIQNLDVRIAAYDVNLKKTMIFSKQNTPNVCLIDAVLASCAMPFIFSPIQIFDHCYSDGGELNEILFHEFDSSKTLGLYLFDRYRNRANAILFFKTLTKQQRNNIISIDVSKIGFLTLNPSHETIKYLYNQGKVAVENYFQT